MDDLLRDISSDPTPEVIAKLKQIEKSPLDPELKDFFSNNPFPKSDTNESHFNFQNNDLVILIVHKNTNQTDIDFCISYLLYSFLYWKELEDNKEKTESLLIFLKSLIAFSTHDIIKKIVLYLFSFYFYQEEHKNIQQFEIFLQEYYNIEQLPTKQSFPLLPAYISLYEKSTLLDFAIRYVMNNEITSEEALVLVNSIKKMLFNLRKEAISLFCLINPYLNQNKSGEIIKEFVQKLFLKVINSDFSFYVEYSKNTLTEPTISTQNHAVNYEPIKTDTFSKIKFDLNSEFVKQQISTSKIISPDIRENFKMFAHAILSTNAYLLNIFTSTLFGKLEEAADKGNFWEIYALLLYTLRKTKKCLLDFIFHPVVFQTDKRDDNIGKLVRYGTNIILDEKNFSSISFLLNSTINYNFVFENVLRTFIKNINIIVKMSYESPELISLFSRLSKHFQLK
ncbi:hypothetical protein TVAG_223720 [Trichomonas vaginalis G3]|uniref:Uncharacterized protein n=1 Tax=Trichomonas vaginalis (strain ATCC PRA-98 / G3) TaxID=412133 RepID=A2EJ77_TRIV3|nr:hypothetical protein TVAGG3_0199220 [Trichomonas vaginalis G3]EAY07309.1 hypothetical protein TVAG_223720 [Trichomonas vaginalis G3]KAI5550486.1 hypothetical protein TVAGG3_0199220 [Trichomonas vaginalis G3]|eukprot:XP_001319532.1 hypothetical protein [Trichomonas vaginalis G3]